MYIANVVNFPFPTPPDRRQLSLAEERLRDLGALSQESNAKTQVVTPLGRSMSAFPVAPRFAKMLALSEQHDLMPYTILLVSALSVQEVLLERPIGDHADAFDSDQLKAIRRRWTGNGHFLKLGDPGLLIKAVLGAEKDGSPLADYCGRYALRHKAMVEIRKLRRQLTNEVNLALPNLGLSMDCHLEVPTDQEAELLRQVLLSGMVSNVARKVNAKELTKDPKERSRLRLAYTCGRLAEPAFLHGSSAFALRSRTQDLPEWIVYQEIFEASDGSIYLRGVTAIEPEWLPRLAPSVSLKTPFSFRVRSGVPR